MGRLRAVSAALRRSGKERDWALHSRATAKIRRLTATPGTKLNTLATGG